jgi:hemoglobin-like flavoprotein
MDLITEDIKICVEEIVVIDTTAENNLIPKYDQIKNFINSVCSSQRETKENLINSIINIYITKLVRNEAWIPVLSNVNKTIAL